VLFSKISKKALFPEMPLPAEQSHYGGKGILVEGFHTFERVKTIFYGTIHFESIGYHLSICFHTFICVENYNPKYSLAEQGVTVIIFRCHIQRIENER